MHDIAQPNGKIPLGFAKKKLIKLMETILDVQVFWSYVILKWVPKCKMQNVGGGKLESP